MINGRITGQARGNSAPGRRRWGISVGSLICSVIMLCPTCWGQAQPTRATSQTVVVVLDDSGSMDNLMRTSSGRLKRIVAAKEALTAVLSRLPAGTRIGVLALNSQVDGSPWVVPLENIEGEAWRSRVAAIAAVGGTPLGEFLKQGADALLRARAAQPYGSYRLLVVTDGEANDQMLVDSYLPEILARGLMVDVIGVDMDGEHSLALRAHSYRRADDAAALQQALTEVLAETALDDAAGAADFELLSGLPDEFASEAVKVLTQRNDEPIVGVEIDRAAWEAANPTQVSGASWATTLTSGLLCCCCPMAMMLLAGVGLMLVTGKRQR